MVDDFTTSVRSDSAFWHAASSCMVPMTLSSFIVPRAPAVPGVAMTLMWTTVSTSSRAITLAITGLRMSARTNWTSPMSPRGGITSTPITRPTVGSPARARAKVRPRSRETPVTRTVRPLIPIDSRLPQTDLGPQVNHDSAPGQGHGSLTELAALHPRLLQKLAVLLLGHALAPLLDDRTHVEPLQHTGPRGPAIRLPPSRQWPDD